MSGAPRLSGLRAPPELLVADGWGDYELVDSGDGAKLERFGPHLFMRPDSQALWPRRLGAQAWERADARFSGREGEDMGRWAFARRVPESWAMQWGEARFLARCTPFRHLGVFPEQSVHWSWCADRIRARRAARPDRPVRVLNLFGYTGLASLVAAAAGAETTHVDASKKAVAYARENQALSGLESAPLRWIVDDALKFVEREARRGRLYDGIILDPPKHGRGPNGEVWKLDEGLARLLAGCAALLDRESGLFMVATLYAVRLSCIALANAMAGALDGRGGVMTFGEMALPESGPGGRLLPTAIHARWQADAA